MPLSAILSPLGLELARKPLNEPGPLVITAPTSSEVHALFSGVIPVRLFNVPIRDPQSASAVLAALWLGHDALDQGHRLAQDIASPTGSFWHAIMHRREGDFSNAKYWYARCRTHSVNKQLGAPGASLASDTAGDPLVRRLISGEWDGSAFVDLVESVHRRPTDPRHDAAMRFQHAEWVALFDHCVSLAGT